MAAARSRVLWLRYGWTRIELFRRVESAYWRYNAYPLGLLLLLYVGIGSYLEFTTPQLALGLPLLLSRRQPRNPGARMAGTVGVLMLLVHAVRSTAGVLGIGGELSMVNFNDFQAAMVLLLVILLQQGKGGDIAAALAETGTS